ncbi:hypothetical protein QR680_014915 [Steinernema hermaphroditum]|uniref:Protein HIRA n=1 Tax=Steinernema hermaphroditum TaxID=289476 RepID=A0AA39IAJ2_9BILA|nr:hypothetical protein QR680_014915 [Steinernema hermaphroditum]
MKVRYYPTISHHDGGAIYSVDFHPSGDKMATCGQRGRKGDGTIVVWSLKDLREGFKRIVLAEMIHQKILNCVRWSKIDNGRYFACAGDDAEVFVYAYQGRCRGGGSLEASSLMCAESERYKCVHRLIGHTMDILHLEWSQDGRFLASASVDSTVIIWDATKLPSKVVVLDQKREGHLDSVKGISFDPVGKFFTSQSVDKTLKVWTTDDWKCVTNIHKPFQGSGSSTIFLRQDWSPDGAYIVAPGATNNGGPTAQIIARNGWTTDLDFVGHRRTITCIRACPRLLKYTDHKGKLKTVSCFAVASSDKGLSIWSIPSVSRPILVISNLFKHSIMDLAWCGTSLAACSMDGTVRFLDFQAKELGYMLSDTDMAKEFQRMYKTVPRHISSEDSQVNSCIANSERSDLYHGIMDSPEVLLAKRAEVTKVSNLPLPPSEVVASREELVKASPSQPTVQQTVRLKTGKKKITPVFLGGLADDEPALPKTQAPAPITTPTPAREGSPIIPLSNTKKRRIEEVDDSAETAVKITKKEVTRPSASSSAVSELLRKSSGSQLPRIRGSIAQELRPISTYQTEDSTAVFHLPPIRSQLSIAVSRQAAFCQVHTINVDNNFKLVQEASERHAVARITSVDSNAKQLWTLFLDGTVILVEASSRFTIIATQDGFIHIISTSTGRLRYQFALEGMPVQIRLNRDFVLVLSSVGMLWIWDLGAPRIVMKESVLGVLSKGVTVDNVLLLPLGTPVLGLSNGRSLTFCPNLRTWTVLTDRNDYIPTAAILMGPSTSREGILSNLIDRSSERSKLVKVNPEVSTVATEIELERALIAAESLCEPNEYSQLAEKYIHHLEANGMTEKAKEFLDDVRKSELLNAERSQSLLISLISILKKNPRFDANYAHSSPTVMPFVRIDFASHDCSAALQKTVNNLLARLQKPPRLICTFLGFRCDYTVPKKRILRSLALFHNFFLAALSVFLFSSLIAHFYLLRHFESASLAIEIVHVLVYCQGFTSFVFLLWWQKNGIAASFHQSLIRTTSGVGFVKHSKDISKIHSCSFIFGCLIAFLIVVRFGIALFTNLLHSELESPLLDYSLFPVTFRLSLLISSVFFTLSIPAANSILLSLTGIVIAEFQALASDFSEDVNTFQLAVTKHYISVHWKISRLWLLWLHRPVTILFSSQIVIHLLSLLLLAVSGVHRSEWPLEIAIAATLVTNSIVALVLIFIVAIRTRSHGTGLQYPMTALVASERALHDQTYSAVCVYNGFLQHSTFGVFFCDLVLVEKRFVFHSTLILVAATAFFLVYQKEIF